MNIAQGLQQAMEGCVDSILPALTIAKLEQQDVRDPDPEKATSRDPATQENSASSVASHRESGSVVLRD